MQNYFNELVKAISANIDANEQFTCSFSAECMDFARFNHAKIRQAGTVNQHYLSLSLINQQKHADSNIGLSGKLVDDKALIDRSIKNLRAQIAVSAADPYLMINEKVSNSESVSVDLLPAKEEIVESILRDAEGLDLVGSYIGGPIYKGFANSFGQLNWFEKASFIIDTSVYYQKDQAIKQSYADTKFEPAVFKNKMAEARHGLELFKKPVQTIKPGTYRVYFAPDAVYELFSLLNWGGFSKKALKVKSSPLLPLSEGKKILSPAFSLSENCAGGIGPNFQGQGFLRPDFIPIIKEGQLKNTLVSPKTAKEYKIEQNGADTNEFMASLDMAAGNLLEKDILSTLGDGLYINNLWYLNYSDRQNGCMTGMTRFFCYVVKNGMPYAPFSVMRFDDSIYNIFGKNLAHISKNRELIIDNSTYDERSTTSAMLPGILVEDMRFTL